MPEELEQSIEGGFKGANSRLAFSLSPYFVGPSNSTVFGVSALAFVTCARPFSVTKSLLSAKMLLIWGTPISSLGYLLTLYLRITPIRLRGGRGFIWDFSE